ncbi:hypothetical protein quinque_003288 [Culex quinquefasciatus]
MNYCRLCVAPIPDPAVATKVDSELSDGSTVAEKLDDLFGILVGDYCDADVLKAICNQCTTKIVRGASGQLSVAEMDQTKGTAGGKKIVVREIQLDQDEDDGRETVVKTKCPFCPKVYVLNSALINHIGQKHPDRPVKFKKCDTCSKQFLNAAELKVHKCPKAYTGRSWGWGWGRRRWW